MNRLQQRKSILPNYGNETIPKICMDLHTTITSGFDPIVDVELTTKFLYQCLMNWTPSACSCKRFDDAVKEMVSAVLEESRNYKEYCAKRRRTESFS